jgi:ribosome-binding factor A
MKQGRGQSFSKQKFEEKILNEVNFCLRREFSDPRLQMCTVTHVELNQDYSVCKIFWDTFDAKHRGEVTTAIKGIAPKMRSLLAQKLDVRHVPTLSFFYNSQYDDEAKINKLLNNGDEE